MAEAEFASMSDEEMIAQWVLLGERIGELRANPKAIADRVQMLEESRSELGKRLLDRGVDPSEINSDRVLESIRKDETGP